MNCVGRIIAISELNVKVLLSKEKEVKLKDILVYKGSEKPRKFEVVQINSNIAYCIPFERVNGLKKGMEVEKEEGGLKIQYSDEILGKVFNPYGELIDNKKIKKKEEKNVYERNLSLQDINIHTDPLWTGIKALDFFTPLQKGFKIMFIKK